MALNNSLGDFKSQVLAATDLVRLVSQSVVLKRVGKDYKGLCPFHQEKTPSFKVDPGKQLFYCFGCKASGTAFDFVMRRDRVEFRDALRILADQAGLQMPRLGGQAAKPDERKNLLEAHSAACAYFESVLGHAQAGAAARAYLEKRGITPETTRTFRLGLAVEAWDGFLKSTQARKFDRRLLAAAGLIKERTGGSFDAETGYYDTFRHRLIFPIRNESGQVIAFGGRVMPGSDDPAKYLNSPETPLFSKGRCVFGLDLAKQKIVETRTAVVVEGYTDVVVAHQCGVANVVSVLGTAMTEQHLSTLKRFADRIVLLFDADSAGDRAVDRAVELFLTQPVEMAIASMPPGVDPDEFLLAHGAAEFEKVLAGAIDVLSYKWTQLQKRYVKGNGDLTAQQKAVEEYLELLAGARGSGSVDPLRWGQAVTRVSRMTEIPVTELNRRFKIRRAGPARRGPAAGGDLAAATDGQQAAQVVDPAGPTMEVPPVRMTGAVDQAERQILGLLLAHPASWHRVQVEMDAGDFVCPRRKRLATIYWDYQRHEGEPVLKEFIALLSESDAGTSGADQQAVSGQTSGRDAANLAQLAVELVDEVEHVTEVDATLTHCLAYLNKTRKSAEEQKRVVQLDRISHEKAEPAGPESPPGQAQGGSNQAEALFAEFVKGLRATDLHKLGPVR